MRTEIKEEIISHPSAGELKKKFIYTFDDNGNQINKEFYVEPVKVDVVNILKTCTNDEILQIKQILEL